MIDEAKLEFYLSEVKQRANINETHKILMQFMCGCLLLVNDKPMPNIFSKSLSVAKNFWLEGKGLPEALTSTRIECWNYLDALGSGINNKNTENTAIRAVICILYANPESDDFSIESTRWFVHMFNQLRDTPTQTN